MLKNQTTIGRLGFVSPSTGRPRQGRNPEHFVNHPLYKANVESGSLA